MEAFCKACESVQPVELVDDAAVANTVYCSTCGEEFVMQVKGAGDIYDNYKIGKVLNVEEIPKQKLKKVLIDVVGNGDLETAVQIVTNAKHIEVNELVVVALENAIVPAGSVLDEDAGAIQVKPTSVGGVKSYGMVCDSPMLKWVGGAAGIVQKLSEADFKVGDKPPAARPVTFK